MARKKYLLDQHIYSKWQNEKGIWYTYLPDNTMPNNRRLVKRKNEADIDNIIIDYWERQETKHTLKETVNEAIDDSYGKGFISASTHDKYLADSKRFFSSFDVDITELNVNGLTELIEKIVSSKKLKRKAYNNMVCILRKAFIYARRNGIVNVSVAEAIEDIQISDKWLDDSYKEDSQEVYSPDEIKLFDEYLINHLDNKNLCLFLVRVTGCRIGEMTSAKHSDFTSNTFKVRRTQTRFKDENGEYIYQVKDSPKTLAGNREVVLPKDYTWLIDETKKYNTDGDYIFLDKNGKPYSSNVMNNRIKKICKSLGIEPKSPHKLRKTYASMLYDAGVDEKTIIRQMGHTNFATTNEYYNRNRKNIDDISAVISTVPELRYGNQK